MDFISNSDKQRKEMLAEIGLTSIEELLCSIPKKMLLPKITDDDGLSEFEGIHNMEALASKNTFSLFDNYLGAGAYEHYVPALVAAITSKSEFLTAYTPYQPEASQGMLQIIFEFQSAICALTGLDVSNASLYDGASACAEGLLMALRSQKPRHKVLVADSIHPQYRGVIKQYLCHPEIKIEFIPIIADGTVDLIYLEKMIDDDTAAVLIQCPNFFGGIEDVEKICNIAKRSGALTVLSANPLVYGLYKSAAELGADIAVGDCQPFGLSLQFGGPYVGYIACRQDLLRQLPGRIVGETVDALGNRGYVLTLQTREQHIRREKATSNICTNQALASLASLVGILWYGKKGIQQLALTNYQRAAYLKDKLKSVCEPTPFDKVPFFNEFIVRFKKPSTIVQKHFRKHGIEPGVELGRFYSDLQGYFLVAVTETKSLSQLDKYVETAISLENCEVK
jgi:glycine dehydrogenase subunit 1